MLRAWPGSPSRTPCFPGPAKSQGGNHEVHSSQPARPAMPLVGGGGEAGREEGERGAGAGHSGGSLGSGPGASHSIASSPNPSWVLSALLDHLACPQWWTCVFTMKINRSCGDFPCKWPGEFFLRMRGLWWLGLRGWMLAPRRVTAQNTPRSGGLWGQRLLQGQEGSRALMRSRTDPTGSSPPPAGRT